VVKVLWKETAFPRWRATDSRWNRYVVSLVSSVTAVDSSTAQLFQVPAVSMATGNIIIIIIIIIKKELI